jgi:hypothetical protein
MTDDERDRIARDAREQAKEDAKVQSRLENVESRLAAFEAHMAWGIRAIWAAAIYLATKVWEFIAGGGVLK